MRKKAEQIFLAGVESVLPERLIQSQVKLTEDVLKIAKDTFSLSRFSNIYVLGAGKASALMAKETEKILGNKITGGHVITKYGHGTNLKHLTLSEAGHPIPDIEGVRGTEKILEIAQQINESDLIICLISGGASALMTGYPEGITLDEIKRANELLVKCGADITEINTVRKHLSRVKGGQLAKILYPATTVCLILSDVIGDKPDVIASGPTVGDTTTFADAVKVIEKYSLQNLFPSSVLQYLYRGVKSLVPETPKPNHPIFQNVHNYIIGSNKIALKNASRKATALGFESHIITRNMQGDVAECADTILKTIENCFCTHTKPACLLFGGEPTVTVSGNGLGGRNQHLALYLASKIDKKKNITILCAGTDGNDGPTEIAGAVIDNNTLKNAANQNIDINNFLTNFDSYHFFHQVGRQIITGNTGTNVMDMVVAIVQ